MARSPQEIYQFYLDLGYEPHQAAAITGSLQQESQFNPKAVGDQGTAFGMGQWRGPRFQNLKAFASKQGTSWQDPETQLRFLDWEIRGGGDHAGPKLLSAGNLDEAVNAAYDFWRPAASRAVETAKRKRFAEPLLGQKFVPKPRMESKSPVHPDVLHGLSTPSTEPSQFIPLPRSKPELLNESNNVMAGIGGLLSSLGGQDNEQQSERDPTLERDMQDAIRRRREWHQGFTWL